MSQRHRPRRHPLRVFTASTYTSQDAASFTAYAAPCRVHGPDAGPRHAEIPVAQSASSARAPNGRSRTHRAAALVFEGRKVSPGRFLALVRLPGSEPCGTSRAEGLDKIFTAAGAEWRLSGCSMCLAMNAYKLHPGLAAPPSRSTATSRCDQAPAVRTHLSPGHGRRRRRDGPFVRRPPICSQTGSLKILDGTVRDAPWAAWPCSDWSESTPT